MKNVEGFLDWLVALDVQHYVTVATPDYKPSGKSHFYIKGSRERFTSKEMINIFNNKTNKNLHERWLDALAQHEDYNNKK